MTYDFVPQFSRMLTNLSGLLDKAQEYADARKFDSANLLATRLAPDQFHFTRQIQIACDTAKGYAARLAGRDVPKQDDVETTISQLKERIEKTVHFLGTIKKEDFKGWEDRKILNPRREGKFLPAYEFAMHQAIPNFYFHVTTAYSILRSVGIPVGKLDYLGKIDYRDL